MSDFNFNIKPQFEQNGGQLLCSSQEFVKKVSQTKAFVFDWDGVFNSGVKADNTGSPFSEVDSMGLNMLRFSFYLRNGFIPEIYVITGENNQPALELSKREHFTGVYLKAKKKQLALEHFLLKTDYNRNDVAFVFDDILDLGLASEVGLRFYVNRKANPLLTAYINDHALAEYFSGNNGQNNAVREVCEICIGAMGNYNEVIIERVRYTENYQNYLTARNNVIPHYYKFKNDQIEELNFS